MEPELMMRAMPGEAAVPLGGETMEMFSASGAESMPEWMIVPLILFYALLYIALPLLMIFAARENWRTMQKKETLVEFVGFWRRISLAVIDTALSLFIVPIFFNLFYYFRDGQTIADKIYGTKLVDKKTMATASVGQLFIRKIAKILSALPLGFGFITVGWCSEKRAWHDGLADVRYISYKKVHGFWTWLPILIVFLAPIVATIVIGAIEGYQEAAMRAMEM